MKKLILTLAVCLLFVIGCDLPTADTFKVIYYDNGSDSGFPPIDENQYQAGTEAEVLGKGTLLKTEHEFKNWNTEADGTGDNYEKGDKIKIKNTNIFLYAQWKEENKENDRIGIGF